MTREPGARAHGAVRMPAAMRRLLHAAGLAAGLSATLAMSGCFGLAAGGAAMGTLAFTDRRTIGTQTEDQGIELKAVSRLREGLRDAASNVSVTSYNRKLLLSGRVADEQARTSAQASVAKVENVRSIHNELVVDPSATTLSGATTDSTITARVKASFVDAKDLHTQAYKVVTDGGIVYLMGIVTQREGERGAQIASRVSGVRKVVTIYDLVTEDELGRLNQQTPR